MNETYNSGNYPWVSFTDTVYLYKYQGYVIWGMTAKILTAFLDIIREGNT